MSRSNPPPQYMVVLCFGLVYLFWGSTYLGIDIAVKSIPPGLMCAVRFLIAGVLMLVYCRVTGKFISYDAGELAQLAAVGLLLLMGGNLTLSYAELIVPSGLAALLISVTPLWMLVLDTILLGQHRIAGRGLAGLVLGLAGTAVLLWPQLMSGGTFGRRELWYSLSLLGGSLSWALGSVLSKRWGGTPSLCGSGWQMFFAGVGNLIFALANRDLTRVRWTASGVGAIAYLVVCGSLIGYTSYIWLLGHVPTSKVSTYAYVNPVVAVFLGWLIEKEHVDRYILTGSAIVITSVVLVSGAKVRQRRVADEIAGAETAGD